MWQKHYLVKGATVTSAKVEDPLDLGLIYPLSALILSWEISTAATTALFADECKLEVKKDGGEIIFSENFGQTIALIDLLYPNRKQQIADLSDETGDFFAVIPFGRFIGDMEYFLDPRGWNSLDLTITQPTFTGTPTIVYNVIAVRAIPPLAGSRGFFKFSNKRQYTIAAATEYIPLDRRHKYVAIIAGEMDGESNDILDAIDEVKINCDAGVFTPIDLKERDLFMQRVIDIGDIGADPLADMVYHHNYLACNWVRPWLGEEMLFDAPAYGSVVLEILGTATLGTCRVAGLELVLPGEVP